MTAVQPRATKAGGRAVPGAPAGRGRQLGLGLLSVAAGVALWHLLSLRWPPTLLPGPVEVAETLEFYSASPILYGAVGATLFHMALGAGLVILVGSVLGFAMGLWRPVATALQPWVPLLQVVPGVAAMAFALVVLGVGSTSVVLSMFVVGIGYMILNVWHGFDDVDAGLLEMADAFRTRRRYVLTQVITPAVIPHMITGARIVIGISWHVIIFAEFVVGESGIGQQVNKALYLSDTSAVFAWGLVVIVLMAALDFGILRPLERFVSRHREGSAA